MIYRAVATLSTLFVLLVNSVGANELSATCANAPPLLSMSTLVRRSCQINGAIRVEEYSAPQSASIYASDFDTRRVATARGANLIEMKLIAGIFKERPNPIKSQLLHPPYPDEVQALISSKNPQKRNDWKIYSSEVTYRGPNEKSGYAIDCATALRSTKDSVVAIAECFALEDKNRFLKTLDAIRR